MKVKLVGMIYAQTNEQNPANPRLCFWEGKNTEFWVGQGYIPVCEHIIEIDAPDVDIVAGQVQCLITKRDEITKKFQAETAKIDDALAQLKCLTFDAGGVAS